jgi:hypothetical protein
MHIYPKQSVGPVTGGRIAQHGPREARPDDPQTLFERTDALTQAISGQPDTRPDRVQRARDLIADVQYPPTEAIEKISHLLALNLNPDLE